jgi:hypothetical protein
MMMMITVMEQRTLAAVSCMEVAGCKGRLIILQVNLCTCP